MNELFQIYENGVEAEKALFLYHGTGGNEIDLLPLVEPFLTTHTIVGIRGNVQQQGMNRYFIRHPDGTFDHESIRTETEKLQQFLREWKGKNQVSAKDITHIGYSNGANFILANLFLFPSSMTRTALLHPMLPFEPNSELDLSDHDIFFSWAENDEMIAQDESIRLIETLKQKNANIQEFRGTSGHRISREEVEQLEKFLSQ